MIIKILILVAVLFIISRIILRFKDGLVSVWALIAWLFLWIAVIVATLLPWTTDKLANFIGVGRGVDAILYMAIIILFYGFFRMSVKLENIEYEITQIVRKNALKNKSEK